MVLCVLNQIYVISKRLYLSHYDRQSVSLGVVCHAKIYGLFYFSGSTATECGANEWCGYVGNLVSSVYVV